MRVTAQTLQLRNVSQLAQTTTIDGMTVMGRLDSICYDANGTYALSIGGHLFHVPASHPVEIRRTANLDELVTISDDLAERLTDERVA